MAPPGFFAATGYVPRGLVHLLRTRALWKYGFWAFLVNAVLFTALAVAFVALRVALVEALSPASWPAWSRVAIAWAVTAAAVVLFLFLFTVVGNIVAGPFLDAMAARMLGLLGESPPSTPGGCLRSLRNQVLKLAVFGAAQVVLLLLVLTPVGFLHPVLSALATVFFLGFEYMDYALDARGRRVGERYSYALRRWRPTLGFGCAAFFLSFVPLLGYLALPALVCGGTLLVRDLGE